jgi:putative ABC transport system permease protein
VPDFAGSIDRLDVVEGRQIPGEGEVTISQDMMLSTGFHPGDIIEIELPDGTNHHLTVAGLITDQMTSRPDPNSTNNAYATFKTLRTLGLDSSFNRLFVTVDGSGSDPEIIAAVASDVQDRVESSQREVYRTEESLSTEHPMTDTILAVIGVLGALGILVTILSSSLIINTLNALFTQQLRQIGVMKLVGGRSYQILGMYLSLIVAYGVIALAFAIPLGAIAGYGLAWYIANLMGAVLQGFRIIPAAVVTQVLVAILVPLAAGFFPVNSGAKTSIQRAISNYRPGGQSAKSGIVNFSSRWFGWISRPILLSFRNTFRKRGRLLLTIFTLTVAGAVFIAVFNVRDSMGNLMDQLMQHFLGDVTVSLRQPYRVGKVEQVLLGIPGVEGVEGCGGAAGEIGMRTTIS